MTANSRLPLVATFSLICFSLACFVQGTLEADVGSGKVSQATFSACQSLAGRLKVRAFESIKITEGPFESGFGQSILKGCSLKVSSKPDNEQAALQRTISTDWSQMPQHQADGPGGMAYAIQNANTVCFVSQEWDAADDDATPEEMKKWKPKPDSITIGCTDKQMFEQIDNRNE